MHFVFMRLSQQNSSLKVCNTFSKGNSEVCVWEHSITCACLFELFVDSQRSYFKASYKLRIIGNAYTFLHGFKCASKIGKTKNNSCNHAHEIIL